MRTTITFITILTTLNVNSQNPTGTPPPGYANNPLQSIANSNFAWYRGGNLPGGPAGNNNILGTASGFNSPIFMQTNGGNRITVGHLAFGAQLQQYTGSLTNPLWNTNLTRIGISRDGTQPITKPYSLLHLGYDTPVTAGGISPLGHRSWQDIGTMYMAWTDNFYVGLRQKDPSDITGRTSQVTNMPNDYQDAVITWGDNSVSQNGLNPITTGLSFIFHSPLNSNVNDGFANTDYGREVMRMDGDGHVGIGPVFFDNSPAQNMLHINNNASNQAYMQISNSNGTGQTNGDGFHFGITGSGLAEIIQKENRNMQLYTNNGERIRVSHIGSIAGVAGNPGGLPNNLTRVSISHNPTTPVTRPLALLHLGYNTGTALLPNTTDGWRSWMDVGTFTSNSSDNMYVGLKSENGTFGDRQDAIISWGDNYTAILPGTNVAPDKLRIIFTSPIAGQIAAGPGAMCSQNGLEFVRYVPFHNTSLGINDPRTGFGDFENLTPVGTINPGNTVEINSIMNGYNAVANSNVTGSYPGGTGASGLRFRDLTSKSLAVIPDSINKIDSTKVLSVDSLGNVILIKASLNSNGITLGNICGDSITNSLTNDWEIPLNAHNFIFSGQGISSYNVGIGTTCSPLAKLDVIQNSTNANSTAVMVQNGDQYGIGIDVKAKGPWGVRSIAYTADPTVLTTIGVSGVADCANSIKGNIGVYGEAMDNISNDNMGGFFISKTPGVLNNTGTIGYANNAKLANTGGIFQAISSVGGYPTKNVGAAVLAWGPSSLPNIALYAQVDINRPQDYAGYFDGNVYVNGPTSGTGYLYASDATLKTNIDTIQNATAIIKNLKPKTFYFDTTNVYGLNFSSKKQYGLIAQEVEQVLPELIGQSHQNAQFDTAGVAITQAKDYKTVNYNALFGIMLKAMQEQQAKIDSLTTKLNSKDSIQDARLTALENAINQCCQNAATARNANPNTNQLDVELSDKDAIVLNQNVPNPFAEQTSITYHVPESVGKAQLLFYNTNGALIQTVDIKTRGKGKINVFAADLSSGLYHYTLVADGKVVDSKKMVRE